MANSGVQNKNAPDKNALIVIFANIFFIQTSPFHKLKFYASPTSASSSL
jgi:hypothetical protein